jgi:N-methylhydantoinase A/oxoprolinase/acetone carboxylase beta subunit
MIIGLDVGGTHTDVALIGQDGLVNDIKVPTDPANLFQTILDGFEAVTKGIDPSTIRRVVLSTTLATNIVVQEKQAAVGMVVAGGPGIDLELFRTNEHYFRVRGALDHRGREIASLDENQIKSIGEELKRRQVRYAGVVTKFSVRNPEHEDQIASLLAPYVDRVFIGHNFSGTLNFPRRIATTYLNAAVYPVHKDFFEAVQNSLASKGMVVPLRILRPDGGNMSFDSSVDFPAQTILSGPSASVMGAIAYAPQKGTCLVLDIGGTTTDMAVLIDGVPLLAPLGIEIGPYKTLLRALRTRSIGIGGDSVVCFEDGRLSIGPQRLGRAMSYGGPVPTPTDAFCALGLSEGSDHCRSIDGLGPLAQEMGVPVETAAEQIFDEACSRILAGAREMVDDINSKPVYTVHELWEGHKIQPDHLLILGGPAPQFAKRLKTMFAGQVTVVPHWHVANAIGCALARTTSEVTLYVDTSQQIAMAAGEAYTRDIPRGLTMDDARKMAVELLKEKALRRGAHPGSLESEIIEEYQFNMIRGFRTIGKNIRIRVQIKPGLIQGYDPVHETLERGDL